MYNVLNTLSSGGRRCGRHWQSGEVDSGIHGDIVGYHDPAYASAVGTFSSWLIDYDVLFDGINFTSFAATDPVPLEIRKVQTIDPTHKCIKAVFDIIYACTIDPTTRIPYTQGGYTKLTLTVYKMLQVQNNDPTSYGHYTYDEDIYQLYGGSFHGFNYIGTYNRFDRVANYDTLSDLEADNFTSEWYEVGFNYAEIDHKHTYLLVDIVGAAASNRDSWSFGCNYKVAPYGGTFHRYLQYSSSGHASYREKSNMNFSFYYGVTTAAPTVSRGYVKYKNGENAIYRVYQTRASVRSETTTDFLDIPVIFADVYGKGQDINTPSLEVTLAPERCIVFPNMTRNYAYPP